MSSLTTKVKWAKQNAKLGDGYDKQNEEKQERDKQLIEKI